MENKTLELGRKLKALADRGIGGEKENASEILKRFLNKNGLTIEDLENEETRDFFVNIKSEDFPLFHQITAKVNREILVYGEFPKADIKKHGLKGNYIISCTSAEFIEIEAKNAFFQNLYKEEIKLFYSAFIHANDLGVDPDKNKERSARNTPEELRILALAKSVKKGDFKKQIG